jgi:hypothetical protein
MPIYYIHNNGGRPYKVEIDKTNVKIYKRQINNEEDYENKEYKTYKPEKIFIGKSPKNKMTTYSGGHGKKFDGNSILLQLTKYSYTYIGSEIYTFRTDSEIIDYVSPIGNSDVPYPYAIDSNGYYYLMLENIKIKVPEKYDDCYNYYYQAQLMTPDLGFGRKPIFYSSILDFKINNESYTMRWVSEPVKDFKRLQKDIGKSISIKTIDGKIIKLTEKSYKKIMDEFNENLQAIKFA